MVICSNICTAPLAWGLNTEPTRMAESCSLNYRQLAQATE
jgi:hypothetical protein